MTELSRPLSIWTRPLRLPRLKPRRWPKVRLRVHELHLLRLAALGHLGYLYGWGLMAGPWWRLGTLLVTSAWLLVVLHGYPPEEER